MTDWGTGFISLRLEARNYPTSIGFWLFHFLNVCLLAFCFPLCFFLSSPLSLLLFLTVSRWKKMKNISGQCESILFLTAWAAGNMKEEFGTLWNYLVCSRLSRLTIFSQFLFGDWLWPVQQFWVTGSTTSSVGLSLFLIPKKSAFMW